MLSFTESIPNDLRVSLLQGGNTWTFAFPAEARNEVSKNMDW
jgi:hypothetical protein